MSNSIEEHLYRYFGFSTFRSGQKEVVEKVLAGHSTMAIFPTGAGKSLCYQLPALLLSGLTIVVSPLLSLMHDQLDSLISQKIPAACLDSSLSADEYSKVLQSAISGGLKILMISVERFKNERFRLQLAKMNISLLVVDEAHSISEWGHNFRPEYLKLPAYKAEFSIPQVLLLTATATQEVIEDMCEKLSIDLHNVVKTGFYRKNLHLKVTPILDSEKKQALIESIISGGRGSTIVYVTLQNSAEEVAKTLQEAGVVVSAYHAGMKYEDRQRIQDKFMQGDLHCIVATIAFGMGIDKSDIRQVIHYDLPKSIENYSQEIGRAGRDGNLSHCEILANRDGLHLLENFVYGDTPSFDSIKLVLQDIIESRGLWEVRLGELSKRANIRQLPLKTLLVYLEIEGVITSLYSYFGEYQFKSLMTAKEILSHFTGERAEFLLALFQFAQKKKVWITIDVDGFVESYNTERKRVVAALDYLHQEKMIELSTKQSIEAFRIEKDHFDSDLLAKKLFSLFVLKEKQGVTRVQNTVNFFESDECLSRKLAHYFSDTMVSDECGHCSVCDGEPANLPLSKPTKPLSNVELIPFIEPLFATLGKSIISSEVSKFLCGIKTPLFTTAKVYKLAGFGALKAYQYAKVLDAVEKLL